MNGNRIHPRNEGDNHNYNGRTQQQQQQQQQKHVGILAMEVYTPKTYVRQAALEEHAGVPAGKYTLGLGQQALAIPMGDAEDINSICLTALHGLLEK